MKTVAEIARIFGVTTMGVRYWISCGLPYKHEKVIGIKRRMVIDPKDVVVHLGLSEEEAKKYLGRGND